MRLDVFPHVLPRPYFDRMMAATSAAAVYMQRRVAAIPCLYDLEARFRVMDRFEDYAQVLTLASPPIEALTGPEHSPDLARLANESMAELVRRYPDRFRAFVASLPMNAPEAALRELARAIDELGARGVQVFTNVNGRPLDRPEFLAVFGALAERGLPVWIHPARTARSPDYVDEDRSRFELWWTFGWPYETSLAMGRLVFAGVFERYPDLAIITHHGGGMVPHFAGRVGPGLDQLGARTPENEAVAVRHSLRGRPLDHFRRFYGDTALFGAAHATRCAIDFFGADHILFGTDMPFDPEKGLGFIRETIGVLDGLDLDPADRWAIDEGNARRLLRLEGTPCAGTRAAAVQAS